LIYFAPKILGGVDSIPLAGGIGRRSRSGAIRLHDLSTFMVGPDEFAVEAYLVREQGLSANEKAVETAADAGG
jgi:diaminohydroxyphosphoribosylaminopyrimidine deaminase/5-amino-6-(5-phosphoribosylamino)uracil reductase